MSTPLPAQLTWDARELEFHPAVLDTNIVARFVFRNEGTRPVKIVSIKSTCDCSIPELKKKVYAPGEKGEVSAIYPIEEHSGLQEKTVNLRTDDSLVPLTQLKFKVYVPDLIKTMPRVLRWQIDEALSPKVMTVAVAREAGAKLCQVKAADAKFKGELGTIKDGEEYTLTVTPLNTSQPGLTVLKLRAEIPGQPARTCFAYAMVK
ncbi:MAG: DUF1573 domain-containing protein [Verrucomicrobiae bacterium]|nr:DUF1573 domain-containing protein [Verrucomicrobiae bacterium]